MTASDTGTFRTALMPITYAAAPVHSGNKSSSTVTLTKGYSSTTKFTLVNQTGITIMAGAMSGGMMGVTVGRSVMLTQSNSTQVAGGLVLTHTMTETYGSLDIPMGNTAAVGDTVLFVLQNPKFQITGTPSAALITLLKADGILGISVRELQNDVTLGGTISLATGLSLRAQYPLANEGAAVDPLLPKMRFRLRGNVTLPAGDSHPVMRTTSSTISSQLMNTATMSVTITDSEGFSSSMFKESFSVGSTVGMTVVEDYESAVTRVITLSAVIDRTAPPAMGTNKIYYDRLYKTFVITDPPPTPTAVQGTVTDASGHPVPGAVATITQNGVDFIGIADAKGAYTIAQAPGDGLTGTVKLTCAGVTKTVTIGSSAVTANLSGVNAAQAVICSGNDSAE